MPEISVIIPVYNTERYLTECLESILKQSFKDFEAIVVNDGATDKSAGIIEDFARKDSRIVVLRQENKGLSEARNAGINIAKGNWITFVDSDDTIAPSFLEILIHEAKKHGADIACSGKQFLYGVSNRKWEAVKYYKVKELSSEEALASALFQKDRPDYSAWNKLYIHNLWEKRRFMPGIFFEDMEAIPQVFLEAKHVVFIDAPLYQNRRHRKSILATPYDLKKVALLDIAESTCTLLKGKGKILEDAASSNLFSASCSILMRTPDSEVFADYRNRAYGWIKKRRFSSLFNRKNRFKNKVVAAMSFLPRNIFAFLLRWGLR